ncbi:hypothetical protein KGF54_001178 [Candida jiufengensis]|uniref:uncharacterized protein n=1 Tax=Candida jiufengensis TaxID=497108 RepID=UPI002224ACC9|nr:uncharacterized protein KGF54_001178 [Candida jiufengensis]KAI5955676.1 hypothetical protein KGF54_001178 [Candida jiufengensis]
MDQNLQYKSLTSKIRRNNNYNLETIDPIPPTILTFEFENVYVSGLKSKQKIKESDIENFKKIECEFYQLNRGGELTWHGKGQLVTYLVLNLKDFAKLSPKCYVNNVLLKPLQNVLKNEFKLETNLNDLNPGIFYKNDKIASIGVRIRHGVTEYGTSLNLNPDLKYLNTFEMCGIKDGKQTSLVNILRDKKDIADDLNIEKMSDLYVKQIADVLSLVVEKTIL